MSRPSLFPAVTLITSPTKYLEALSTFSILVSAWASAPAASPAAVSPAYTSAMPSAGTACSDSCPATRQGTSLTKPPLPQFFPYPNPSSSFLCSSSRALVLLSLLKRRNGCHLPWPCALTQMEVEMALFPMRLNALEANILSAQNNSR